MFSSSRVISAINEACVRPLCACARESVSTRVHTMAQQKENIEMNKKSKKQNRRYETYSTFHKSAQKEVNNRENVT